ncbi:VOC family protein [Sphaerisporangium corydalis]|uniref:VOC family protein n=1 Tax=Sphaerisporangium corydalis TaxID=1441875 RepID=A0ABV9E6P8_9ACTN|nr:VOC family protein [Sphaerisporangium corydalis]
MEQRLDFVTLGVPDLGAVRDFYLGGLGWEPVLEVPGEIIFLQVGHGLVLGLFGSADLDADVGAGQDSGRSAPFTLSHNVEGEDEVREVMEQAREAGATILKEAQPAAFGGFHGYFADPAGFRWEVCFNPGWSVAPDGTVGIVPV